MQNVSFKTLENISIHELSAVWNRCWQGYFYDMSFTPRQMKVWLNLGKVALKYSVACIVNNDVIGFSLLAIEGSDGWIAGTAIDPMYRGHRLFKPLIKGQMNLAKRLGLKRLYLEVLSQNYAHQVYSSAGFSRLRSIYIYRFSNKIIDQANFEQEFRSNSGIFQEVPLEQYFTARRRSFFIPAWQRREGYLRRYPRLYALLNLQGTAGALLAGHQGAPLLDIWSGTAEQAPPALTEVQNYTGKEISITNQPEDWITAFLNDNGVYPKEIQFEMCADLI